MKKLDTNAKHQINGGITQLAIFGIITAVGVVVNLVTNVVSGVLNAKANAEAAEAAKQTPKQFNINYQQNPDVQVY